MLEKKKQLECLYKV